MKNKDIKEFYRYKHYGTVINKVSAPTNNQNKVYEVSHIKTGQRLIHGQYALCKHKFNSLNPIEKNNYVICKYKQ